MEFSAKQISDFLEGEVIGDKDITANNISSIESGVPNTISFLGNSKYEKFLYTTKASIVIVNKNFHPSEDLPLNLTLIKVDNAQVAFQKILELASNAKEKKVGISTKASIDNSVKIGTDVYIADNVVINKSSKIGNNVILHPNTYIDENVEIGDNTEIYPNCSIYSDTKIGDNCKIHSNTVVGSDGFGFLPNSENNYIKVPQIGNVIIEDNVEIGSNVSIDRATFGTTLIKKGVKLDNLIQVAHNVIIGENTVIAAQTGIAGSTKIGKNCMIGGQVGFAGHLTIGDGVKIGAQSGISRNVENDMIIQGSPAFEIKDYHKSYALFRKLPTLIKEIEKNLKNK